VLESGSHPVGSNVQRVLIGAWALGAALSACSDEEPTEPTGVDSGSTPVDNQVSATLTPLGVATCADPTIKDIEGPFDRVFGSVPAPYDAWIWHGGITAADLDLDGRLDVLTALEQGVELYVGEADGSFTAMGQTVFAGLDLTFASGVTVADYDGDGDLDLYVMRVAGDPAPEGGEYGRNRLLRNNGDRTFVDVTDTAGVDGCGVHHRTGVDGCFRTMASSWGDYDRDGDLDLYVGNYGFVDEEPGNTIDDMVPGEPDFLYQNNGDGTFSDRSDLVPDDVHDGYNYSGGFFDLNNDGWLDIYTVNDFGTGKTEGHQWPNQVLWNDQAGGFDMDDPDPLKASGLVKGMTGMGLAIDDLDGDGLYDLLVPVWRDNLLLESSVSLGKWLENSGAKGVKPEVDAGAARSQDVGWGSEFGDLDNDGDLDAIVQFGHVANDNPVWKNATIQPDALYINGPAPVDADGFGGYTFTDQAPTWGVDDAGMSRGAMLADLNRDGWLDIGKRILDEGNVVYLSHCGEEAWLEVHLRQPGTRNVFGVGTRVYVEAGGKKMSRTLFSGGTGYASSAPPELHFGLGMVDVVDSIRVVWPDGKESVLENVTPRQQVTITRDSP
jgi:enediyne biosynthesis protein E4